MLTYNKKMAILVIILLIIIFISFLIGRYPILPWDVLKIIFSRVFPIDHSWTSMMESVVWNIRIPRILVALFVGAGLSIAGTSYQGVFRNPLVSPDILGVSAAAGFGAALGIIINDQFLGLIGLLAFSFGIVGVLMAYFLSRFHNTTPIVMLVLSGIVVAALFNAGISALKYMADPMDELPAITFWLMGSLSAMRWPDVWFSVPVIAVTGGALILFSWRINLLSMGDMEARSMGVKTERLKILVIICATLISATCVSICGAIGWVGLVIPHISRMIVGPDHKKLIPAALILGAAFLLLIDNITRTVSEMAIPLTIVTSVIGAPFFAFLLRITKGEYAK